MKSLPVIVGFGGYNPAGRVSCHHAYKRTIIDTLDASEKQSTYRALAAIMGLNANDIGTSTRQHIDDHTLIRRIEIWDPDNIPVQKRAKLSGLDNLPLTFSIAAARMPDEVPPSWQMSELESGRVQVKVNDALDVLLADTRKSRVTSAGQLPTGFDPGSTYESRSHPRALQLAVAGGSDAIRSVGIPWPELLSKVAPDQISVYAGSAMGQLDDEGAGGLLQAPCLGRRPNSKHAALSLPEMPADFVNAYVAGTMGSTGGMIGACATFLYNLRCGIDEIRNRGKRIAIIGSAEAPVTPELVEAYLTMKALAMDADLMRLDNSDTVDNRRACRPFSTNAGFTMAEAGVYIVLMDDALAVELGTNIYGSVADVFVNADGVKKSIPGPGVGNYVTMGKALGLARAIVGEESLRNRSFVHAHGTGTPQNRKTESHILNLMAQNFGIESWPVAAIKAYLGHTLAPASGDQITSVLGTWQYGVIPGIRTIDHVAEDVYHDNLRIGPDHIELEPDGTDVALVNSKGFGGNNATGVLLSPTTTKSLIADRYSKNEWNQYKDRNRLIREAVTQYDDDASKQLLDSRYLFDKGVLEGEDLEIDAHSIRVPGYSETISLDAQNPYI